MNYLIYKFFYTTFGELREGKHFIVTSLTDEVIEETMVVVPLLDLNEAYVTVATPPEDDPEQATHLRIFETLDEAKMFVEYQNEDVFRYIPIWRWKFNKETKQWKQKLLK